MRGEATLVVDLFPHDSTFKLGPESKPLKRGQAKLRFPLSARKREVLEFAAQACDKATLASRGPRRGTDRHARRDPAPRGLLAEPRAADCRP